MESSEREVQSKVRRVVLTTAIVGALASAMMSAQDKGVKASNAWVKLPSTGETEAMAFVTIENPGMQGVNVSCREVGFRKSRAARRRPGRHLYYRAALRPGVDMSPGGVHLRLLDLKRPLKEGDTIALTLSTDVDVTLEASAIVRQQ